MRIAKAAGSAICPQLLTNDKEVVPMKHALTLLVALTMMLCLLCGSAAAEVTYPINTDDHSLTFWLPIQPIAGKYMSSYNEHKIYSAIGENTGIDVDFQCVAPADAATQLGLVITDGDLPDLLQIRAFYPGGAATGVSEGIFVDLTPYLEEYAPDYLAAIKSNDLCYRLATDDNGHVSAFYTLQVTVPHLRMNCLQELLDQYGFEIPTTLDDYEAIFARVHEDGMSGLYIPANGRVANLMWPYGIDDGWYLDEDGNVAYGMYTEAYKDYLTMMHRWYKSGYIYPDFMMTITDSERYALLSNKIVFMYTDPIDLINSTCNAMGVNSVPLPYVRLYDGQELHFENSFYNADNPYYIPSAGFADTVISTSCDNIEEAVMYMNYYYTQEGRDLCNWGIKDVTYTVAEDGTKSFTDTMLNNPDMPLGDVQMNYKIHMTAKWSEPDTVCNPNVVYDQVALEKRLRYTDDTTVDSSQVLPSFSLSAEASESRSNIMTDINTYVDEMTLKFITGTASLDNYDAYMEQLKKMGMEEAIEITQTQYETFMNKPGLE